MHTLSIFPALLDFGQLGPFFIRITLGVILAVIAERSIRAKIGGASFFSKATVQSDTTPHIVELAAAILIFIGLFTQAAALATVILMVIRYVREKRVGPVGLEKMFFLKALTIMALSLMFTGAGFLAFDLPL